MPPDALAAHLLKPLSAPPAHFIPGMPIARRRRDFYRIIAFE
jgi:hypothetical protein